jgi:GNAT superfamily N-acetyltransferase
MHIRALSAQDDVVAITSLLHRAYARLGAMGLNYTAVDQSVDITRQRMAQGECFVATDAAGAVIGTVTVAGPYDPARQPWAANVPWFIEPQTAHFHQLAVDPSAAGQGIGDALVARCEVWAKSEGFARMACDTAIPAHHLRHRYARLGYAEVGEVQWDGKTYRSVILQKDL